MIIAADKGAEYCLDAGVRPDLVVGDMDSVSKKTYDAMKKAGIPLQEHDPAKDKTDTQIALEEAIRRGATRIELIASTGDRFDHSLANVHLLYTALADGVDASILTRNSRIFLVNDRSVIPGMRGATISLLPMTMEVEGITLTGFQWNLKDASMKMGDPYGISNKIVSDEALISLRTGILIVTLLENEYALQEND